MVLPLETEWPYWLALLRVPKLGPIYIAKLLASFKHIKAIFTASLDDWQQRGLKIAHYQAIKAISWQRVEQDWHWLQQAQCALLTLNDPRYPAQLREIAAPPPVLFVQGNVRALQQAQLAMVGSRNPSSTGKELALQFAQQLVELGLAITSGLALGIDAASHQGALSGQGVTLAVLGTGLDQIYPAQHRKLAEAILANQGALVSEFSPQTPPIAANFPRRNRIISGLSLGTLVVEAALQSGSLLTANYAIEQGREVFAIPSSIHNPLAKGCHALLKQGAKLVETVADILAELPTGTVPTAHYPQQQAITLQSCLDQRHIKLVECLGYEVTSLESLVARTTWSSAQISAMLLELELAGEVAATTGGYIRLTRGKHGDAIK